MRTKEVIPPKNAESVEKTPPVELVSVEEKLRRRSAEESVLPTLPHGKRPCVASVMLRLSEEMVAGRRLKKLAASLRNGGIKKKMTPKNTAPTMIYIKMTPRMRLSPCRRKNRTAGSIAEAITTAVSTTSTMSRRYNNTRSEEHTSELQS